MSLNFIQTNLQYFFSSGMLVGFITTLLIVFLGFAYKAIQPPKPKRCGTSDGPPVTSPRVQLKDGRFVAYREYGTPKEKANYKVIFIHGFCSSKDFVFPVSQELIDEQRIYFLSFDRAGYGESDPDPKRTVKSAAMDVQELADKLGIGPKFYVVGHSMGGYVAWSCLQYIPNRLAGVVLFSPMINYWWTSFPRKLLKRVYSNLLLQDQVAFWIIHHAPWLVYWWMTQRWFPTLAAVQGHRALQSRQDEEILKSIHESEEWNSKRARQQGDFESLHRDLIVGIGSWDFAPTDVRNPFPNNEGSVHIWQGGEDKYCPVELQRCIAQKLAWIKYHEYGEGGHQFIHIDGWSDRAMREVLNLNKHVMDQ